MSEYADYLRDKRVIVVGTAPHVLKQAMGQQIDDHDIVVRINQGFMMLDEYSESLGARTDVLYLTDRIFRLRWLDVTRLERIPWRFSRQELGLKQEMTDRFGFYPRTGVVAIYHLLQFPLAGLHVVGFTGYFGEQIHIDGYFRSWKMTDQFVLESGTDQSHSRDRELEIYRDCLLTDPRLTVDEVFDGFLAR